ncbi:MAG TPA: copper chaperone PCu(A)C [Acidimicrobiia bacterium]|nr:copper chaperone PCu(A)C [Acidimicrobiia bacterium]
MRAAVASALALVTVGCGSTSGLEVTEAFLGQPTGPNAALYLSVTSDTEDRLVAASTPVAEAVELHETAIAEDGTTSMHPVEAFEVTPTEPLILGPGGKHLMLVEADRLDIGDAVEIQLEFETAGTVAVTAEVVSPAETLEHDRG